MIGSNFTKKWFDKLVASSHFTNILANSTGFLDLLKPKIYEEVDQQVSVLSPVVYGSIVDMYDLRLVGARVGKTYTLGFSFNFQLQNTVNFGSASINVEQLFSFLSGENITSAFGAFGTNVNSSTDGRSYINGYVGFSSGSELLFNFNGDDATVQNRIAGGTIVLTVE